MTNVLATRRVYVVEDDASVRESLLALIRSHGCEGTGFASAEEFLERVPTGAWGCLVLDMRLGGMSGLELQERLRSRNLALAVVVITGYGDVPTAVRSMRLGAITFLQKPCPSLELWQHIGEALDAARLLYHEGARREAVRRRFQTLNEGERQVYSLILQGLTNRAIADLLEVGLRTVELRRAAVFRKLEAETLPDLVRMALEVEDAPPPLAPKTNDAAHAEDSTGSAAGDDVASDNAAHASGALPADDPGAAGDAPPAE